MAEIHPPTSSSSSPDQSSSQHSPNKQNQIPTFGGLESSNGNIPTFPIMYPTLIPGLFPQQDQDQMNRGPGLYAVHALPFMQPIAGLPPTTLIPFTYNLPTERNIPETREVGSEQGQAGEQPQQDHLQAGPQRQVVVRRFQIAIHLDLMLILKLAAVIFLFNQDGSKQRLTLLVFFAILVYLHQTGALAPVVRWLSQGMRRAAAPPRPAVRADNLPGQGNENAEAEGQAVNENENHQVNDGNRAVENENGGQGDAVNGWWIIVKEIQMIVFGFITSLLPGFHNID